MTSVPPRLTPSPITFSRMALSEKAKAHIIAAIAQLGKHIVLINMVMQTRKNRYQYSFPDDQYMKSTTNRGTGTSAGQPHKPDKVAYHKLRRCNAPNEFLSRLLLLDVTGIVWKAWRRRDAEETRSFPHSPPTWGLDVLAWIMRQQKWEELETRRQAKLFTCDDADEAQDRNQLPENETFSKIHVTKWMALDDKQQTSFG